MATSPSSKQQSGLSKYGDLKGRLIFLALALVVYRIGAHVPVPGIDPDMLKQLFDEQQGGILGLFNMFSGGALSRFSVFALGIMPYISASIIMQMLSYVLPELEALRKEGESGRRKITQYTRYSTVLITIIQGFGIAVGLETMYSPGGVPVVLEPGWTFRIMTMLTLTAGTVLIMWLGEQITEKGIGNGISLIIFSGIVVGIPGALVKSFQLIKLGDMSLFIALALVILMVAVLIGVVFMERAQRRIPIQYAKRQVGRKMYGGQSTHIPMKVNMSGVMPIIFAQSIASLPATIGAFTGHTMDSPGFWGGFLRVFDTTSIFYIVVYFLLIVGFSFFYSTMQFNPVEVANNLKKNGGFIPGFRPGKPTADFIHKVLNKITMFGALYLAIIAIAPIVTGAVIGVSSLAIGGTSIIIVVGVALETTKALEAQMLMRHYKGFLE